MFNLSGKEFFFSVFNGFLIGIANLIPGVSGGTFALILGLYERLLTAITNINLNTFFKTLVLVTKKASPTARAEFVDEMKRIDLVFLLSVFLGLMLSVLSGAKLIQYLLANHPQATLALFIGLILPSLSVPYKMIQEHSVRTWIFFLPGIALTVIPALFLGDSQGSTNPLIGFLTGAIAISAMVLPGISGSYIMLVLGEYQVVIQSLTTVFEPESFFFLIAFAFGCLVGLLAFTHLIHWLLEKKRSFTMTFLIGLIVGSFYILWPFKDFDAGQAVQGRSGEVKRDIQIATAVNQLPTSPDDVWKPAIACLLGIGIGMGLNRIEELQKK